MKAYLDLVRNVLDNGVERANRTDTKALSLFGLQARYDLRQGFPLVTTKKVNFGAVLRELLWFLRGSTNIHDGLSAHTSIWNPWADDDGELGPIYGHQWRRWPRYARDKATGEIVESRVDQIRQAIDAIKNEPHSRRIIVSAWNVADLPDMALPPCHLLMQFYVADERLDLQVYQRSADLAVGAPFNIASYALLLMMMAQECNLQPGVFIHSLGDAHVYVNHVDGLRTQLQREPFSLPRVRIRRKPFFDLRFEDFTLLDYRCHAFIKFPVAV